MSKRKLKIKKSNSIHEYGQKHYVIKGKNGSSLVTNDEKIAREVLRNANNIDFMKNSIHY